MQDAATVRRIEATCDADRELAQLPRRHRPRDSIEAAAADQLLDEERPTIAGRADAKDRDHVRMREPRARAGRDQEALAARGIWILRSDQLDRDGTVEHGVMSEIDLAHAAATERTHQPELVEITAAEHAGAMMPSLPAARAARSPAQRERAE